MAHPFGLEFRPWSKARWLAWIAAVFGLQSLLLLDLAKLEPTASRLRAWVPAPRLLPQSIPANLSLWWDLNDPALFALARPEGFAGQGWKNLARLRYDLPAWIEPPLWLEPENHRLGLDLARYLDENPAPNPETPAPSPDPLPLAASANSGRSKSVCQLEGTLAARQLGPLPALPPIESPDVLSDAGVRLVVDGSGRVISALLINSSGSARADQLALDWARKLRFKRAAGRSAASFDFGWLAFQWAIEPPRNPTGH